MGHDRYEDARATLNFLLYQAQLLEYQGQMMRCKFGEYRPEPPIKRKRYRADVIRDLYECYQRIAASLSPLTSALSSEFAAMLLKPENKEALDLLKPVVMEGDCYWAGREHEEDPEDWVLMFARGTPDEHTDTRFCQQFPALFWTGKINARGDIIEQPLKLVWKADAGSIEGWSLEPDQRERIIKRKRHDLMERRRAKEQG